MAQYTPLVRLPERETVIKVVFSPTNDNEMAYITYSRDADPVYCRVYDLSKRCFLISLRIGSRHRPVNQGYPDLFYFPDGKRIALGNHENIIRIISLPNASIIREWQTDIPQTAWGIVNIVCSPDGEQIASLEMVNQRPVVKLWRQDGQFLGQINPVNSDWVLCHGANISVLIFLSNQELLTYLSFYERGEVFTGFKVSDTNTRREVRNWKLPGHIYNCVLSNNGLLGMIGDHLRICNPITWEFQVDIKLGQIGYDLAFSADGRQVVVAQCYQNTIYDTTTGNQLACYQPLKRSYNCLIARFSKTSQFLVTLEKGASDDESDRNIIQIWRRVPYLKSAQKRK